MKIDFIIISGILVIISFLPFILFPLIQSKEGKKLKRKFKAEASRLNMNISYELKWNNNLAGIDIIKRQFLFVQKSDPDFKIHQVDLNRISEVKPAYEYTESKSKGKQIQSLSQVNIEFLYNNSSDSITVNLFDYETNYSQDLEIKNAQKLVSELQKYLNTQPVLKRTA